MLKNRHNETARDLISHDSPLMPILLGVELICFLRLDDITNLKLLLSQGANINFRSGDEGYTPLLLAVKENRGDIVEFLLSMGADLTVTLHDGRTIFDLISDEAIGMKVRAMIRAVESECDEEDDDLLTEASGPRVDAGRSKALLSAKAAEKGVAAGERFFTATNSSCAGAGVQLSFES